jgi:hypothetical protein
MIFRLSIWCLLSGTVFFTGCSTTSRAPAPVPAAPVENAGTPAPAPAPVAPHEETISAPRPVKPTITKKPVIKKKPVTPPEENDEALQPGEYALMIESDPPEATVVIDGKPCGKTPCRVIVRANTRGFLRSQVSIKVRFIATNEDQSSQTVEEVLTTFDKVPSALKFTKAGATRIVR